MEYNEQYFHYRQVEICLALARANCTKDGLQIARSIFPHFFETCHGSSGCIWWKLSINAHSPHALPQRSVPQWHLECLDLVCLARKATCLVTFSYVLWVDWGDGFESRVGVSKGIENIVTFLYLAWAPTNGENCLQRWWWSVQRCSCYDQSSYACISGDFAAGNEDDPLVEHWDILL